MYLSGEDSPLYGQPLGDMNLYGLVFRQVSAVDPVYSSHIWQCQQICPLTQQNCLHLTKVKASSLSRPLRYLCGKALSTGCTLILNRVYINFSRWQQSEESAWGEIKFVEGQRLLILKIFFTPGRLIDQPVFGWFNQL